MRTRALQIVVVLALIAAAFLLRGRDWLPTTPEDAVSAFFDAAGRGDDAAYLRLVGGELKISLEHTRAQLGAEGFRKELQRSAAGIKGLAVTRSGNAPPGRVSLDVDIVFVDRNERQRVLLVQEGSGWQITSIKPAATVKPPIPYGTPVFAEPESSTSRESGLQ